MSFIDAHGFPAGLVLRVLGIPASTYYDWRARQAAPSRRQLDDAALLEQIVKIRAAHEHAATYGSPRVWLPAAPPGRGGSGASVWSGSCATTVWPVRTYGEAASTARPDKIRTTPPPQAGSSATSAPTGRTGIDTPEATAACSLASPSAIRRQNCRCSSRRLTGGRPGDRTGGRPARSASCARPCATTPSSEVEVLQRPVEPGQYTALRFTHRLADAGLSPSTGFTGGSYAHALAENLWSTLKIELVYGPGTTFATRAEVEHALLRYTDGWYNLRRIQAGLGGLSADEYENVYQRAQRASDR